MKRNKVVKAVALTMGAAMSMGVLSVFAGCKPKTKEHLTLMSDELNELFNPFYSTAGSDMEIVGMTQIGMFTTDESGDISFGTNKKGQEEACVALDYKSVVSGTGEDQVTDYYFVLRNDVKFSDGMPLTMNDVLFNYYVYLDPAYAGSSTMYSTDIKGLQAYRTQSNTQQGNEDEQISATAASMAYDRTNELYMAYTSIGGEGQTQAGVYNASVEKMRERLATWNVSIGYMKATGFLDLDETDRSKGDIKGAQDQLVKDYNDAIEKFEKELENDYKGAKDAYTDKSTPFPTAPIYDAFNRKIGEGFNDIISFMYMEGFVEIEYGKKENGTVDKNKIVKATLQYDGVNTPEEARAYVYRATVPSKFDQIISFWGTAAELTAEFTAKAKDIILHDKLGEDGSLKYPNIEGIKSLGHYKDANGQKQTEIEVNGKIYKIATEHNADGTPAQADTYDVLKITVNKIDPKAIWNFGLTIAPHHYYSDPEKYPVDIENNKFGVEWAKFDFQTGVLQGKNKWGVSKNKVPLGAGPYVATSKSNADIDKVGSSDFIENNIVYYKANENFLLGEPKIKKLQYRVTNASNAIGALESGLVDFVTPQFTTENGNYVKDEKFINKGFESVDSWQLGYGYIGINATYVENRYLRYAIMAAMDTQRALSYYASDTAVNIYWGMSAVSWAYPRTNGNLDAGVDVDTMKKNNGHDYAFTAGWSDAQRIEAIENYMSLAGVQANDPSLKFKFTIAGSSMTEHPCYLVFLKAVELLNSCGWDVEIQADTNALTKLSTGTLEVWAAAWGSSLDPDMYQVWHKKSTATSTLAWGYNSITADTSKYSYENGIINKLSDVIDEARGMNDRAERAALYEIALGYVLDLGVELPVYQRKTLYAFNLNTIKRESLAHDEHGEFLINPYTSPLNRIWDVELVD